MKKLFSIFCVIIGLLSCSKEEQTSLQIKMSTPSLRKDTMIVYISKPNNNPADWRWDLFKMNLDGTGHTLIVSSVGYDYPVISHKGDKILFTRKDPHSLYITDLSGINMKMIEDKDRLGSPVWSLNDSVIVYSIYMDSENLSDLVMYDIYSGNKKILISSKENIFLVHDFVDNRRLLYTQGSPPNNIYIMNMDDSTNNRIITNARFPVLSPDHSRLAYVSIFENLSPQIMVADIDGSHSIKLTSSSLPQFDSGFGGLGNYDPHWTPDGEKIVYESEVNDGNPEIYIMNSDGSRQTRLTNTERRNDSPTVTPDGKFILFTSNRDMSFGAEIYVMDINGTDQYPLSKYIGDDCFPITIKSDD